MFFCNRHLLSKTNCGGNTGRGDTRRKFSHAEAVLKWMLRTSMRTIDTLRQARSPESKKVRLLEEAVIAGIMIVASILSSKTTTNLPIY